MTITAVSPHAISLPAPSTSGSRQIVREIALKTLAELAISLAIGSACCFLVATPAGMGLIFLGIAVQTVISLAIRSFIAYADYRAKTDPSYKVPNIARWLTPSIFSSATLTHAQTLVHEAGHALAANALLKNSHPKIHLTPFTGGFTRFDIKGASPLGKWIGKDRIMPLVSAAGPLAALGISSLAFTAGLSLRESSPEISRVLIVAALTDFFVHIVYALTAFFANPADMTHDFISLWTAGIHPAIPIITMIAIPTLIFCYSQWRRERNCSSERISIPSFFALSYLEPGSSPTST